MRWKKCRGWMHFGIPLPSVIPPRLRAGTMACGRGMSSRDAINGDFESMRTGVIFDDDMGRVIPNVCYDRPPKTLIGYNFAIEQTWDGHPVAHDPIHIRMEWHFERAPGKPHKRVVKTFIESPLFDDPDPPSELPGICPGLWNYEVVELFFANAKNQYLEVEVGPHGHWLCILHDGFRRPFNTGENLQLEVQNTFIGDTWRCTLEIPLAYFPAGVETFNAYGIHGSGESRVYEALSPVTDGTFDEPDFHQLQFFKKIELCGFETRLCLAIADTTVQDIVRRIGEKCRVHWGNDRGFFAIRARHLPIVQQNDLRSNSPLLSAFLVVVSVLVPMLWFCLLLSRSCSRWS